MRYFILFLLFGCFQNLNAQIDRRFIEMDGKTVGTYALNCQLVGPINFEMERNQFLYNRYLPFVVFDFELLPKDTNSSEEVEIEDTYLTKIKIRPQRNGYCNITAQVFDKKTILVYEGKIRREEELNFEFIL